MGQPLLLEIHRQAHAQSTMNLCIVSFQTLLLAVLLVQYHHINEVEAEKNPRYPNRNWFNSVEKRIEIVQNDADPEAQVIMEQQDAPIRKKKIIKKHKKKIRTKHEQREHARHEKREHILPHVPHEQRLDASVEKDKEEYGKRVLRKDHKKREKQERFSQRTFVKASDKESNSSESDEVKRRKPVDIIVHIKMND